MRRFLLVTATVAVVCGLAAVAQAQYQSLVPNPSVGIKAGINAARFDVEGASTSNRNGFVGGAYARLPLAPVNLRFELLYANKGFTKRNSSNGTVSNWDLKTDNIELPVTIQVDIPAGPVRPYILAGVSLGWIMSADQRSSLTGDEWTDAGDALRSTNWMLVFGFGVKYSRLALEFRWNHGISDIAEADLGTRIEDRGYALTVGYAIWR